MHIFRSAPFRALALALALPLAALVLAGCDVDSTDSTTAVMADNEGNIYNYSGLYMSITNASGSTNGYGTLVFPAGRQSGRMTCQKMRHSLHPSMRAASDRSFGMVMKNWRSRNTLNAPATNEPTHSGRRVPIQPTQRNRQ